MSIQPLSSAGCVWLKIQGSVGFLGYVLGSHRRPRSRMSTRMPFSARRRAVIAPPKPLPITMASKDVGMAALDRRASAADAFLAHADVGGRIVPVVAPARVVELNHVVAVVRADR